MRHQLLGAGALLLLAVAAWGQAEFRAGLPAYSAVRCAVPPVLDGRLDDPCWQQAPAVGGFKLFPALTPSPSRTEFRVAWDEQELYLAVTAWGEYSKGAKAASRFRDEGVWGDDAIEIFLDPGRTETRYWHLGINADNVQADEYPRGAGLAWNGEWRSATRISADRWELEVAVPWATLGEAAPQPGTVWGLGVDRDEPRGDAMRCTGWSPGAGGFHVPHENGYLLFGSTAEHLRLMATTAEDYLREQLTRVSPADMKYAPASAAGQIQELQDALAAAHARAAQAPAPPIPAWLALARRLSRAQAQVGQAVWTIRLWALLLSP